MIIVDTIYRWACLTRVIQGVSVTSPPSSIVPHAEVRTNLHELHQIRFEIWDQSPAVQLNTCGISFIECGADYCDLCDYADDDECNICSDGARKDGATCTGKIQYY